MQCCLDRGTAGRGLPLPQFVQIAAEAGFAGADVDLSYAQQNGINALQQLYGQWKMRFGAWSPPDWRGQSSLTAEELRNMDEQAKIAARLKIDACCTYILPSDERKFIENWRFHVDRLGPIAAVLAGQGLRFGLEFVAPEHLRHQHPHEFIFTPGQMLELADEVGQNVGLLVDSFHCHAAGVGAEQLAALPAGRIVWVHLNDAPDVPRSELRDFERVLPGEGVIDLPAFLSALKRSGYAGDCSLEVFNPRLRAMDPAAAARRSWEATRGLFSAASSHL